MKRGVLISTVVLLALIGIAGIARLFLSSLKPSERAYAEIPRVRLPVLGPGEFTYINDPTALDNWPSDLLLVRRRDGSLKVWIIPTRNGVHLLPDVHWWRQGNSCPRFEPDFQTGVIACIGSEFGEWANQAYRWDLNGKNINGQADDMQEIRGREDGGEFVFMPMD